MLKSKIIVKIGNIVIVQRDIELLHIAYLI